jgi:hypothetical protein
MAQVQRGSLPEGWDDWVRASPQGNPFATTACLQGMAGVLGLEADLWSVTEDGALAAALPVLARRRLGARTNHGVPLYAYTSPLFSPDLLRSSYPASVTARYLELSGVLARGLCRAYGSAVLKFLPDLQDVRPWLWTGWTAQPAYTYLLDLGRELRVAPSVRKHVRKGNEAGHRFSLDWDLDAHCALLRSTVRRQGVWTGLPEARFRPLAQCLHQQGLAWMGTCLSRDGEPLSSRVELGIQGGNRSLYDWTAGSLAERLAAGATPWLMVRMVEEARARGYASWDLCGASVASVARFKSEFGGRLAVAFLVQSPRCLTESALQDGRSLAARLLRATGWRRP